MVDLDIYRPEYPQEFEDWQNIPGFCIREAESGYTVIELDLEADPAKRDPAWFEAARKWYPSEAQLMREMRRNWSIGTGEIYFPEWAIAGGRNVFLKDTVGTIARLPVIRGWDLGVKKPSVVWIQVETEGDWPKRYRTVVYRSILPGYMPIEPLGHIVQYLSGERSYRDVNDDFGKPWLDNVLTKDSRSFPMPWFEGCDFLDFAGHEKSYNTDMRKTHDDPANREEALGKLGINVQRCNAAPDRDDTMRHLLTIRSDGRPGILLDPQNERLISALEGGLTWEKPTSREPTPKKYRKDGVHDDVYEALMYAVCSVVPPVIPDNKQPDGEWIGREYIAKQSGPGFNSYEVR